MNRKHIAVLAALAVGAICLLSCSQKKKLEVMRIMAYAEGLSTKASMNLNGEALWRPFESIGVFGNDPSCARFTYSGSSMSNSAWFVGAASVDEGVPVIGLSPYDANAVRRGSSLLLDLPSSQASPEGTVDELLFRQAGSTLGQTMKFHQIFSGIRFTLSISGVKSIRITGNSGEPLAGKMEVSFSEGCPRCTAVDGEKTVVVRPSSGNSFISGRTYLVALAPQTLSRGLTFVLETAGGSKTVKVDKPLELARGQLCLFSKLDLGEGEQRNPGITEMVDKGVAFDLDAEFVGHVMEVGDCYVAQGAASDGENVFFVLRNSSDNGAVILKYSLSPFRVLDCSDRFDGGHCNDLTYNDKTGKVVLAHGQTQGKILTIIDSETLKVEGNVDITVGSGAIAYNASRDRYAISQGGTTLHFADGSLKTLSSHSRTDNTGYTAQGMGCDDKYVYFPMSGSKDNKLVVYDWNARYVMTLTIPLAIESESMFSVNGEHYVCFYSGGTKKGADLYRIRPKS